MIIIRSFVNNKDAYLGVLGIVAILFSILFIAEYCFFPVATEIDVDGDGLISPNEHIPAHGIFSDHYDIFKYAKVELEDENETEDQRDFNLIEQFQFWLAVWFLSNPVTRTIADATGTIWNMMGLFFRVLTMDFKFLWVGLQDFALIIKIPVWITLSYAIAKALPFT